MNFIMKKQMEMKKGSKKGFTLVEVIVVIVIIAILAAIAVPALTGYIDRARDRAAVVEARNVVVAMQTILSDANYAPAGGTAFIPTSTTPVADWVDEINKLIGGSIADDAISNIAFDDTTRELTKVTVKTSSATVTFEDGTYGID